MQGNSLLRNYASTSNGACFFIAFPNQINIENMAKNLFNSIQLLKPKRNAFDMSHDVKMSLDLGDLVPCMCEEAVPGDKWKINSEALVRFAPMVSPVMHRFDVSVHYFFIPYRILWPNWEKFITNGAAGKTPNDPIPAFPTLPISSVNYGPLSDYLGIPNPQGGFTETVSAMPYAAYQMVYNEFYRDQNLIAPVATTLTDGNTNTGLGYELLRKRAWEHDYFTAALPFAQRGNPVSLPIAGFNDVDVVKNVVSPGGTSTWATTDNGSADAIFVPREGLGTHTSDLVAKTSNLSVASTTINDLRRAFRLQEWLERAARGGGRYAETILNFFGVKSPDQRLQRPEYITGMKTPVVISEVLSTTDSSSGTSGRPLADMGGHGIAYSNGHDGYYNVQEHGYIMGIMSVMPKTAYQQGIPKHFLKTTDPFEFYWPQFANIGEQPVENRELYAFTASGGSDPFGYVPRYAEYKFASNRVAGDFRTTLDYWHMGRIFATPPALNQTFVECDPGKRIFAVTGTDNSIYAHVLNKITAIRPMPRFGTPTI